jgi:cytochrome oxidase assembly protein ShyY1
VTITARLRDSETAAADQRKPFTEDGFQQVYAIDTSQIARLTAIPLTGSYLQLVEAQPGSLEVLPLPKFLSYGIQWIAFGIVAPLGLGYFVYSELKIRRRESAQRTQAQAGDTPLSTEEKLADRYGRQR